MAVPRTGGNLGIYSAGGGDRAADALSAFAFLLDDIGDGSTDNRYQSQTGNNGTQLSSSFLSGLLHLLVQVVLGGKVGVNSVRNQRNRSRHYDYCNQSRNETGCQVTLNNQGSYLVNQESNGIAGAELQPDGTPQPVAIAHFGVHGSDSGKTRRGVEVKEQVGEGAD